MDTRTRPIVSSVKRLISLPRIGRTRGDSPEVVLSASQVREYPAWFGQPRAARAGRRYGRALQYGAATSRGAGRRFLQGLLLGAGVAFVLDPDRGNRRRALARDWLVHQSHRLSSVTDKGLRDLQHRAGGILAEGRSAFRHEHVRDDVLAERVRAALGRLVAHPSSIGVEVHGRRVVLRGPVLAFEAKRLLRGVARVRGVTAVDSQLEVHRTAEGVPGLQGGAGRRGGPTFDVLQESWAPGTRLGMAALGGVLGLSSRRGSMPTGMLLSAAAGALLLRSMFNRPLGQLLGLRGARAVDFHKTLRIDAPVEEVYRFLSHPESFPRFMDHVREVRAIGAGRSHWKVEGPAGTEVGWEAEVTQDIPNEVLAWRSLPGSIVDHAGSVRFERLPNGSTRISVRMSYAPPAGVLGHAVASLFRTDPKHALDEDMVRLKSLIEHGKATAHRATVTREELGEGPARSSSETPHVH